MKLKTKRILMSVVGVLLLGIAIAFQRKSNLGVDCFTALVSGLANVTKLQYSTMYIIVNCVFLVLVLFLKRKYIGIATILNLLLVGTISDLVLSVLDKLYVAEVFWVQGVTLLFALIILCFASSLYFVADLGVSTYDAMALIMADKKILKFKYCRIITDLLCVAAGFFMGAVIGIGTLITAFFMGPVIALFNEKIAKPMLYGKGNVEVENVENKNAEAQISDVENKDIK